MSSWDDLETELNAARTLDQALRDRGIVRIECRVGRGQLTGVDRIHLLLAEAEMRDLLLEVCEPWPAHIVRPTRLSSAAVQKPLYPAITGRLTRRQWLRALCNTVFCGAELVPAERRPEGILPSHTRHWNGVDWIMDPDLPGAQTRHCTCTLTARAAGRDFCVELVVDDLAGIPA